MDKTIEIVVVAMVTLLVAVIVLFLVQDRSTSFSNFLGGQQNNAECTMLESRYDRAVDKGATTKASDLESEAQSIPCDWAT